MTVYVDDMDAPFKAFPGARQMKMSHMIADTEEELHKMAADIGVARKWYQGDHYDVCLSKKRKAIRKGAVEVTWRTLGAMTGVRKATGKLPSPETTEDEWRALLQEKRII
jgi:hypothetical protein